MPLPQSLCVDPPALRNVHICILVVEEAIVALATQVECLRVLPRILQHGRQGHDRVEEKALVDLAHGDIDVALEDQMVRIGALFERDCLGIAPLNRLF